MSASTVRREEALLKRPVTTAVPTYLEANPLRGRVRRGADRREDGRREKKLRVMARCHYLTDGRKQQAVNAIGGGR